MKVLFIHEGILDVRNWSGTTLSLYECLKTQGIDIVPLSLQMPFKLKVAGKLIHKLGRRKGDISRYPVFMDWRKNKIAEALAKDKFDAIFSVGSIDAAAIPGDVQIPVYFYTDGTMAVMRNYYPEFSQWDRKSLSIADEAEQRAADIVRNTGGGILTASQWVNDSFNRDYQIPAKLTHMVRIGANHIKVFQLDEIEKLISKRTNALQKGLNLLFVGVAWERKGGADLLQLCEILQNEKINFHVAVVGCQPVIPNTFSNNITVYGFLNKNNADEQKKLEKLYQEAHFFILPTHAECAGVVFCESSAYALPSLAYDTGGVGSVVESNVNGKLFPLQKANSMRDWAEYLQKMMDDTDAYKNLCYSSYEFASNELNWNVIGQKIAKIMMD